jgi:hypothetical protein
MADDAIVSQIQSMNAMMSGEYADKQLVAQACDSVILSESWPGKASLLRAGR